MAFFKKIVGWFKEGMQYTPSADEEFLYDEFLSGLERYGYLEYVTDEEMDMVKKQMVQQSWPFFDENSGRQYHADAENLAEKGVAEFLEKIRPFLENQEVQLKSIEEYFDEEYRITVNGKETTIWSREEEDEDYGRDGTPRRPGLTWGLSTVRTFSLVNELLEEAGSKERLYAVSGGNDLDAFFLTPELADFIGRSPQVVVEDRPYIPVAQHPWYGQPHSSDYAD
jgi:hypothetical protein